MSDAPKTAAPPVAALHSVSIPHACGYLPGRDATHEYFQPVFDSSRPPPIIADLTQSVPGDLTPRIPGDVYQRLMDHNFRRSGRYLYRPICETCNQCRQIRVPADRFTPDRTQRRILRRNRDLKLHIGPPRLDAERRELYARYLAARHGDPEGMTPDSMDTFLYESCVPSEEWTFRLAERLVMVGIVDSGVRFLSAVYSYFDPVLTTRSLGTFNVLAMLEFARLNRIPHVYLGYYVRDCRKMNYKSRFRPCDLLGPHGLWSPLPAER